MEKRGLSPKAHVFGSSAGNGECLVQIEAVCVKILYPRPVGLRGGYPSVRGFNRDTDAVVLAHEQQGQWRPVRGSPTRGVERPLSGRMIGRGIAKRAHDDSIFLERTVLGRVPACKTQ